MKRIKEIIAEDRPFVVYRKPQEECVTVFAQKDASLCYVEDYTEKGFVFAPFDSSEKAIYFPEHSSEVFEGEREYNFVDQQNKENSTGDEVVKEFHISLVDKGISSIEKGVFEKVVLSRRIDKEIEDSPLDIFEKLLHAYGNAFVYYWYHPKVGTWLGATPERLFKVHKEMFSTMSLAGTALNTEDSDFSWGAKEIVEQQIVTDFILENLEKANENTTADFLKEIIASASFTKEAGGVKHLCSIISGKITELEHLGKIIQTLHPTPAVCGMPKELSKAFILKEENYNRKFYTGFLGELNRSENTDLYVNLRCMEIEGSISKIYVGGGITVDSNSELEWKETVNKSNTMLKVVV